MYIPTDIYEKIKELKKQGKYQEALNIVNEYLKKDPTNEELLLEVTDLQYAMWELEKAEKPVDFLIRYKKKEDPMSWYAKWVIAMDKTDWQTARQCLKKANSLVWGENPEFLRCLGLSEYWYWNKEKWIEYLEKANDLVMGEDAEILYNLIEIYLLEHEYEKAKVLIEKFKMLDNEWKLKYFDKSPKFYKEKINLFSKFLKIVSRNNDY